MICRSTPARGARCTTLAFFVRAGRADGRRTTGNAPTTIDTPHADPRYRSPNTTWTAPQQTCHAERPRGGRLLARARLPAGPQPPSRIFNRRLRADAARP